jgi:hypothetical protein
MHFRVLAVLIIDQLLMAVTWCRSTAFDCLVRARPDTMTRPDIYIAGSHYSVVHSCQPFPILVTVGHKDARKPKLSPGGSSARRPPSWPLRNLLCNWLALQRGQSVSHCSAACSWFFCVGVKVRGKVMRNRTQRSPLLPGSSGTGMPFPGTRSTVSGVIGPLSATCHITSPAHQELTQLHSSRHITHALALLGSISFTSHRLRWIAACRQIYMHI